MLTAYHRSVILGVTAVAMALVLLAAGCAGDGTDDGADGGERTPAAGESPPAGDGGETPSGSGGSVVNGVIVYVTGTGLGGEIFEVAEPINCNAFLPADIPQATVEAASGKVCINFGASEFSETQGVMEVLVLGTEKTWNLTLELKDLSWVVTGDEYTGP